MEKFEKIQRVKLPFDMRSNVPNKNYGIHGLDIWYILKGPKGAVQFMFSVNCFLPHVIEENGPNFLQSNMFEGYDVGYHSPKPMFEGHGEMDCDLLDTGKCYYDGSSLQAGEWAKEIFAIRGERPDDEVWRRLEKEYEERFEK